MTGGSWRAREHVRKKPQQLAHGIATSLLRSIYRMHGMAYYSVVGTRGTTQQQQPHVYTRGTTQLDTGTTISKTMVEWCVGDYIVQLVHFAAFI